ncbi:MAG: nucleotidyltransferase domain-containing protein, partial [Nanoarchaeota archaeon]
FKKMALLKFLKDNENTRKIFGKRELEIIFKQLDGMPLKQSERNRLSRDIKPKFEFIREVDNYKEEFNLKQNQNNKKIINEAVKTILEDELKEKIISILLFGSSADKSFTRKSDIDICVIFKEVTLKEATNFRIRISGQLSKKVDIQVFNVLPMKIKKEIAKNHKILYKTNRFDNINFSIRYLKDEDFFINIKKIFGSEA